MKPPFRITGVTFILTAYAVGWMLLVLGEAVPVDQDYLVFTTPAILVLIVLCLAWEWRRIRGNFLNHLFCSLLFVALFHLVRESSQNDVIQWPTTMVCFFAALWFAVWAVVIYVKQWRQKVASWDVKNGPRPSLFEEVRSSLISLKENALQVAGSLKLRSPSQPTWRWKTFRAFFVLAVVFGVIFWIYTSDESPPNDADLRRVRVYVAPQDNGYYLLTDLPRGMRSWFDFVSDAPIDFPQGEGYAENYKNLRKGLGKNAELAARYLVQARGLFERMEAVLTRKGFQVPETMDLDWGFGRVEVLEVVQALQLRADQYWNTGRRDMAISDLSKIFEICHRIETSDGSWSFICNGESCRWMAYDMLNRWVNETGGISDKDLTDLAGLLTDSEHASESSLRAAALATYEWGSKTENARELFLKSEDATWSNFWVKTVFRFAFLPNATGRIEVERTRAILAATHLPYSQGHMLLGDRSWRFNSFGQLLQPNLLGKVYLEMGLFDFRYFYQRSCLGEFQNGSLRTAIALRRYLDKEHSVPDSLARLVPDYLAAVPIDPFDGKPLRYDPIRGLIYSVGTSLEDKGGLTKENRPKGDSQDVEPFSDLKQPTLEFTFAPQWQKPNKEAAPTSL